MMNGNEIVFRGENNQALTNSLLVAKEFGKEHNKVMRDIQNLACSQEFRAANFGESSYKSEQGKEFPMCTMTKDGFSFLVMGYTGKKAAVFKEAYIKAFNNMEEEIRRSVKPKSQLEILQMSINQLVEQEHRLSNVEKRLDNIENERKENERLLLSEKLSDNPVPEISMRAKIRKLVNQYSKASNIRQDFVWHKIYDTLLYAYKFSINATKKLPNESKLDVLERKGMLGTVFDIVSRMVKDIENK